MAIKYPRITVSRYATPRPDVVEVESTGTVLFAPFVSPKGPVGLQKVYSEGQFISLYGEPNYEYQGQNILNIFNWLNAGGVVLGYRLVGAGAVIASATDVGSSITIKAKYAGAYYNNLQVTLKKVTVSNQVSVEIYSKEADGTNYKLIGLFAVNEENFVSVFANSLYFSEITDDWSALYAGATAADITFMLTLGDDDAYDGASDFTVQDGLIEALYTGLASTPSGDDQVSLIDPLQTPIDVILDAGFTATTKTDMKSFASTRPDISFIFDNYDLTTTPITALDVVDSDFAHPGKVNTAVYGQYCIVDDTIKSSAMVTPTYFLASLIPTNDRTFGIQWPTAGLRRGVLRNVKSVSPVLSSDDKETYYAEAVNYIEKDSRGYAFMSQLTGDTDNTSLRYLNNVRVVNRMEREMTDIGRRYLHEFNDTTSLKNLQSRLDVYITEWLQNRTLKFGEVIVSQNALYDNMVDIKFNITFAGTIEVISVDITIG